MEKKPLCVNFISVDFEKAFLKACGLAFSIMESRKDFTTCEAIVR